MRRLLPFDGMNVSLFDATFWTSETATAIKQRINSDLYNAGVVNGLTVFESGTRAGTLAVTSGVAYDINGERIAPVSLHDQLTYSGALLNDTSQYSIALKYVEGNDGTYGIAVDGTSAFRHAIDSYDLRAAKIGADTVASDEIVLTKVWSNTNGSTLIFDNSYRNTFSAKYAATAVDLSAVNLDISGNIIAQGNITSLLGGSFNSLTVLDGGMRVTGTACFFRNIVGISDVSLTYGDYYGAPGKGMIVISPDGTKRARIGLDNSGFQSFTPLNYSLS